MAQSRVAVVTGSNKGIGLAICRNIALRYSQSKLCDGPLVLYLTARDAGRGLQALTDLRQDAALKDGKALSEEGGLVDVRFQELDVADEESIHRLETYIRTEHPTGLDLLINNAGVSLAGFDGDVVRRTLMTNYYGTMSMTERFIPHLRERGRIVNIASMLGKLNKYSPMVTAAFREAATSQAPASTNYLMAEYQSAVERGIAAEEGWPQSAYAVSKTGVIGATMFLGKQLHRVHLERGCLINACCPGYVSTDMTKNRGRKTVDQGAQTPVHLALGDLHGITGEFWEHEEVSSW